MSVIAVKGLPIRMNLAQVVKMLAKSINGHFEALNFVNSKRGTSKTCYLQLSNKLDPQEVIERINNIPHGKNRNFLSAFVPDSVPHMPIAAKRKTVPMKLRKKLGISLEAKPAKVLSTAHREIMTELQYKYTGLYSLSSKGSHTLLEAIAMTVGDRLKQLLASGDEDVSNSFLLTGRYRKAHPHFGDFQLILGTLHRLEDAAGAPRTQLQESDLTETAKDLCVVDNVPYTKAQEAISKYTGRIIKKLEEHISKYDLTSNPEDSKEEQARKNVRTQLIKMMPYLPTIMNQVVTNHFTEDNRKSRCHRMRMYGEPYLPGKELTLPLMTRHAAQRISRWKTMYNLLVFEVPMECYSKIMASDGTALGASKIILRSSNVPIYQVNMEGKQTETESAEMDDEDDVDLSMDL